MTKQESNEQPITYEEAALLIYDWLTSIMEQENLSQKKIADISGYAQPNISKFLTQVERDITNIPFILTSWSLIKIANHTGYDLPDLDRERIPSILKKILDKKTKSKK